MASPASIDAKPPPALRTKNINKNVPTHITIPWIVSVITTALNPPTAVYNTTTVPKIKSEVTWSNPVIEAISVAPPVNWLIICAIKKAIRPTLVIITRAELLYLALKYPTTVTAPVLLETSANLFPSTPSTKKVTGTWIAAIQAWA